MAYIPTPESIMQCRYEVQDVSQGLYILPDETYEYFLIKNEGSVRRASLDAARAILFRLSIDGSDKVIDVLSIKSSKSASEYRQSLILFLRDPSLNPILSSANAWAGGVSLTEMRTNNEAVDNNINTLSTNEKYPRTADDTSYLVL